MDPTTRAAPAAAAAGREPRTRRSTGRLRAVPSTPAGARPATRGRRDAASDVRARFGANLRRHRAAAGLSQDALAAAARLHRTEISLLERSERDPRLTTVVRLARALRVDVLDLLAGIE